LGNLMLLILNIPLIGIFVNILRIRYAILSPLIALVCFVGAFSQSYNAMDVLLMVLFGFVGYFMRKFDFDPAPVMLAYVLGPMLERALRQSLILSSGSPMIFLTRPISAILLAVTLLTLVMPLFKRAYVAMAKKTAN